MSDDPECVRCGKRRTRQVGERNGRARLDRAAAETIRQLASEGKTERTIAAALGVSKSAVHRVITGETWND